MVKNKRLIVTITALSLILVFAGYLVYSSINSRNKAVQSKADPTPESIQTEIPQNVQESPDIQPAAPEGESAPKIEKAKTPEILKYIVKSGDTLESIASSYKVKVSTIAESNRISVKDTLNVGQELTFPSVDGILYKIKDGETLWDLAYIYDINMNDIVAVNNMDSPDKLTIGQQIIIPGIEKLRIETKTAVAVAANSNKDISIASRGSTPQKPTSDNAESSGSMWPTQGTITSRYGPRWGETHKGLDIAAPTGTNVYAFRSGTVEFSGWNSGGYGNLVIIDHGNGLKSYYAHNSKVLVNEGQSVSKGQLIAKVGSTGNSTGPHSHFEVRKNDVPVNPYNYLN